MHIIIEELYKALEELEVNGYTEALIKDLDTIQTDIHALNVVCRDNNI